MYIDRGSSFKKAVFGLGISIVAALVVVAQPPTPPRLSTPYLAIEAIRDITWDGKAIWLLAKSRPANDSQARFSVYLLKLNDAGSVAQWFLVSESGVEGMVWDGKAFWMTDAQKDQLYQVNVEAKITRVCSAPKELKAPRGIAWDGTSFWILSTSTMKIYKVAIR